MAPPDRVGDIDLPGVPADPKIVNGVRFYATTETCAGREVTVAEGNAHAYRYLDLSPEMVETFATGTRS